MDAVQPQEQATVAAQTPSEGSAPALRVVVSRDTFRRRVTMGEYVEITEGNLRVANEVMARFLIDQDGHPIPEDQAGVRLLKLSLEDYDALAQQFRTGMERAAVPLPNGTA